MIACAIRCQNLGFSRGASPVFRDVNLEIHPGSVLMVRGTNGSGKTSLLRLLAGFSTPQTGRIQHSFDTKAWHEGPPASEIGWLGHKNGIKNELSVTENLKFWMTDSKDLRTIEIILQGVGLASHQHQQAGDLSAGQRRRLALARLYLGHHALWIMDEPSANLDKAGNQLIEQFLVEHIKKQGIAIIASHDSLQPDVPISYIKLQSLQS